MAYEVDSALEKGYMDVVVVLSDRALAPAVARDPDRLDEKRVAGRFWTEGTQSEFGQKWSYDVTFPAPIAVDPAATTVPRK
jgi:hypothetical protein